MNFQSKSRVTPQEKDGNYGEAIESFHYLRHKSVRGKNFCFFFIKLENNVTHPFNRVNAPLQDL